LTALSKSERVNNGTRPKLYAGASPSKAFICRVVLLSTEGA